MIYLDQRGISRSSSPASGDYSLDRMVRDFEEVRRTRYPEMAHPRAF
jgi:proline iminopeptidase